jgi:hypothetical protein
MAATSATLGSASPGYRTAELDYRPSYLAAGITSLLVFILYLITLAPSTAMWDASEYIAAAYVFGLPHPPGNPLFVLLGRVFAILPVSPSVAVRVNVLAALCSAVSAGMWFLITERVLVSWFPERWQRIVGGAIATIIGATAFTVWNQSVVNEKVYTVSLVGIAIISWLMIRWSDEPDGRKADRILVLVAFILGLGFSNHMGGMLAGPAAALAVVIRRPRTLLRWRLLLACVGALVLGLTPFATQPIRAAHMPAINEGEPTACREGLAFDCTFSRETYDAFMYNFNRGQYGKPDLSERQAPFFSGQIGMWWYYFKWQWLRDAHTEFPGWQSFLAAIFFVLGLLGGYVHYRRDRRSFWYFGSLMFTVTLLLIYYLNFKYGNTQAPELGDMVDREVRDRDYFYLWSFSAWGVWAGLGLVFIWETVAALIGSDRVRLGTEVVDAPRRRSWLLAAPVLAIALIPLFTNWSTASRRGHTYTRDFAHDLLNSVEPYGILVTVGDNDTFPLWYAQEVEGIRKDVVVANTSLLNTDWYTRQLIQRPVFEYDEARGPAMYRGGNWVKPSGSPLAMSPAEADSVPPYTVLSRPMILRAGEIEATIDPRYLMQAGGGSGLLQRADIFVLRMLRDSWGQRPLYFSRTSGSYTRQLGLEPYTISQGLAMKVFVPPAQPSQDTIFLQSEGWFDVARSERLWNDVFLAPKALLRRGDWIDRPSVGIPYLYVASGVALAEAQRDQGRAREAQQTLATARDVAGAVRLDQLFAALSRQEQIFGPAPGGDTQGVTP